jgi:Rrf2 family transcriptional regulator, iron-sulfur cluster assembly transcription factor
MLSISCQYALRAAVYLMNRSRQGQRAGIHAVAADIEANAHTTGKILQQLARAGIISSVKGPNGGFFISPDRKPIRLIEIVKEIDGLEFFQGCGLGLKRCTDKKPCPIHHSFKLVREQLLEQFTSITVQELALDLQKGRTFLKR